MFWLDSHGLKIINKKILKKKALVVDLDGTLYTINTFHYFIKFLVYHSIKSINILLLIKIFMALVFRGCMLIPHSKMKYFILKSIMNNRSIDYQKFIKKISIYKRNISIIREGEFNLKILATAAPSCYASIIAKNEDFDVCLGTDFPISNFDKEFENSKEIKKESVLNYLGHDGNSDFDTFITDHLDDIPLMKLADKNILINPSNVTIKEVKKQLISFEIIHF